MGIDGYALSFNYISDVFHVIANKGTEDFDKETQSHFIKGEYKVTKKSCVGMLLDGEIKAYYDDMPAHQSVKEEQFKLNEMVHDYLIKRSLYNRKLPSNWNDCELSFD